MPSAASFFSRFQRRAYQKYRLQRSSHPYPPRAARYLFPSRNDNGTVDYRHCRTSETYIQGQGSLIVQHGLVTLPPQPHREASRNGAHQGDIFVTPMARTILADGDAGMACADFTFRWRIADRVTDLFVARPVKHGKGSSPPEFSQRGESPACHAHHICLCDTAVKMTIRKALFKYGGLCRCGQICVQHYQLRMFLSLTLPEFPRRLLWSQSSLLLT